VRLDSRPLPASYTHFASSSSLNCFVVLALFQWHGTRSHLLPTFVLRKKSRITLVHSPFANRSRIVNRSFPLPVSFRSSAHQIFCCGFDSLQSLNQVPLVCVM